MRARVEDLDLEAGFCQFARDNRAGETRTDDSDFLSLCHHGMFLELKVGRGSSHAACHASTIS
jgi:hypothetical protein